MPAEYLDPILRSLFATQAPVDVAARIWDIFLFEGDTQLLKICIGALEVLETALYGSREGRRVLKHFWPT